MSEIKNMNFVTNFSAHGLAGVALENALAAQFEFMIRLTKTLVEAGVLPPEAAESTLLKTAAAIEKRAEPKYETAAKSLMQTMILERLQNHAQGIRGIASKGFGKGKDLQAGRKTQVE